MSKKKNPQARLQVLMDPEEYSELEKAARGRGMSVGEWVRQALRSSLHEQSLKSPEDRLGRVRLMAAEADFPTGDIDQMNDEIRRGRES
jgi:hypothetical protein